VEPAPPPDHGQTLVELLFDRLTGWPDRVALRQVQDGE
jgi:hypothetical protein